ncbi:uncharacterized protein [Ambystoma mexicanum]|uniref:uncharacterized protein n=1 Tax=Ambystoma mexicanum TaxID=8296 RepID=UPI0037E96F5C
MRPWMAFVAVWFTALRSESGLANVSQHPSVAAALLGSNVNFTCRDERIKSTACSPGIYIYCFIRNYSVHLLYPPSVADRTVSQWNRTNITCDRKDGQVSVQLRDLRFNDSDTYFCRFSVHHKPKDGSGTTVFVYDSLTLLNSTETNNVTLSCFTTIPMKGDFTILWKRDESIVSRTILNNSGESTRRLESILKVTRLPETDITYICQLLFQSKVLEERSLTLYGTGKGPQPPLLLYTLLLSLNTLILVIVTLLCQCEGRKQAKTPSMLHQQGCQGTRAPTACTCPYASCQKAH